MKARSPSARGASPTASLRGRWRRPKHRRASEESASLADFSAADTLHVREKEVQNPAKVLPLLGAVNAAHGDVDRLPQKQAAQFRHLFPTAQQQHAAVAVAATHASRTPQEVREAQATLASPGWMHRIKELFSGDPARMGPVMRSLHTVGLPVIEFVLYLGLDLVRDKAVQSNDWLLMALSVMAYQGQLWLHTRADARLGKSLQGVAQAVQAPAPPSGAVDGTGSWLSWDKAKRTAAAVVQLFGVGYLNFLQNYRMQFRRSTHSFWKEHAPGMQMPLHAINDADAMLANRLSGIAATQTLAGGLATMGARSEWSAMAQSLATMGVMNAGMGMMGMGAGMGVGGAAGMAAGAGTGAAAGTAAGTAAGGSTTLIALTNTQFDLLLDRAKATVVAEVLPQGFSTRAGGGRHAAKRLHWLQWRALRPSHTWHPAITPEHVAAVLPNVYLGRHLARLMTFG
jgi:hypothetical protein